VEHGGRSAEERRGVSSSGAFGEHSLRRGTPVPLSDDQVQLPKLADSQALGAMIGGIGQALLEHTVTDHRDGRVVNANLADYLVPVSKGHARPNMTPTLEAVAAGKLHPELVTSSIHTWEEIPTVLTSDGPGHKPIFVLEN
jgi:hypothetical protein